jgi:hypothetical protein
VIQFACPSCKSICSVGDAFKGRKIKCPKCGARVVHVKDAEVRLLTAGTLPPPGAPSPAPPPSPADAPPGDATPVATAVVPHLVGEFVRQNESKQNTWIIGGLIGLFAASLSILGIFVNVPLLAVTPVGVALSILAVWLWLRKKKLEAKARGTAKTEVTPKI